MTTEADYRGEKAARLLMALEDWHAVYDNPAEVLKADPDDLHLLAEALRVAYVEGRQDALEEAAALARLEADCRSDGYEADVGYAIERRILSELKDKP